MSDVNEIERLWAEHLAIDFPPLRGNEVAGVDLVLLDADISEYITAFLDNGARLAPARRNALAGLARQARDVAQSLTGPAREYFARLARVADLVLRSPNAGAPAG